MIPITPVILCGGSGTRLWPLSRSGFPKQFLCLAGNESLFQLSTKRLVNLSQPNLSVSPPLVVTNEEHRFLTLEQLREIGVSESKILLEPCGQNTAPALTLAALEALQSDEDPVLFVTPSDQIISNESEFSKAALKAIGEANNGSFVILGIKPTHPETGYGYIQANDVGDDADICQVIRFVEKPNKETAERYLQDGGFSWNAGIFVVKASVWLQALKLFRPDIEAAVVKSWDKRSTDAQFIRPDKTLFQATPPESIDYAVIEHCPGTEIDIKMVSLDAGWNDLGSWNSVWDVLPKDDAGNAHIGDVVIKNSHNTLVHASSRLVSLVGVEDLVVVETPDAIMVSKKSECQNVKEIVEMLKNTNRDEPLLHRKVDRPWGWYDSIDEASRFKVKRIQVKPGASLSLQKHFHRAEHWVVVKGTAEVTCEDKKFLLTENQSTFIPLGSIHRLANPGIEPLEIIEVQSGSYLGEDDIVRVEDVYGRCKASGTSD